MDESLAVNEVVRHRRSLEEKLKIVQQAMEPGASVARIARQHGINANLIFNWRKQHLRGVLGAARASSLLPVRVTEGAADAIGSARSTGTIHIKFGKARIRIEGKADGQALSAVLERLLR